MYRRGETTKRQVNRKFLSPYKNKLILRTFLNIFVESQEPKKRK